MKKLFSKQRSIILGSLLLGLIVAGWTNLHYLSYPLFAEERKNLNILSGEGYWKGTVDQRLRGIENGLVDLSQKVEKLSASMMDIQINAAKQGGLYGLIVSVGSLLTAAFVQSIIKSMRKKI